MSASAALLARDMRHSVEVNPPMGDWHITKAGSNGNWAIFALHAFLLLALVAWTFITPHRKRVFHYFSVAILLVASWYYFVLASDLGHTAVGTHHNRDNALSRQVFYARWVGYTINFSLVFWALQLLAGVGWGTILFTILCVWTYTVSHLVGALVSTSYKWGFFAFGVFAYLLLAWKVLGVGRSYSNRLYADTTKTFSMLAAWELLLLLIYPIAWGLCEGGNVLSPNREQAFYCVLDTLSQGIFAVLLVVMTNKYDRDRMGLAFDDYGRHRPGGIRDKLTGDHHNTAAV